MIVQANSSNKNKGSTKFFSLRYRWPRKKTVETIYFALTTTGLVIILKLLILGHGVQLRSKKSNNEIFSSKLFDLENFYWVSNNETLCKLERGTSKLLPILVHSARNHFLEREIIRETYGSLPSFKDWTIRVIFLLGLGQDSNNNNYQSLKTKSLHIYDEIKKHGDIIMGNYVDTYRNLSYKHISGYRWILEYCPQATYVWKVDDDMFLDPLTAINWRDTEISMQNKSGRNDKLSDFYCPIAKDSDPQRDKTSKWYVPYSLWPHSKYPIYCSGWAYGISVDWIKKVYDESLNIQNVFWIDDLFITGILVDRVSKRTKSQPRMKNTYMYVTHKYDPNKTTFCIEKDRKEETGKSRRMFGMFGRLLRGEYLAREMRCIWRNIIDGIWRPIDFE